MMNLNIFIVLLMLLGISGCSSNSKKQDAKQGIVNTESNIQKDNSKKREGIFELEILGKYWRINKIIGNDMDNTQEFTLSKIDSVSKDNFTYGNKIIFNNDNTFENSYSAPCGNDCFPSSTGTFKIKNESYIQIFVKEFIQDGDCENKKIELNSDLGTYYISKESDKIIKLLKRS